MLLVRTTRSEIQDRQETPKSLSAEPYSPCICALDSVLKRKKLESSIFWSLICSMPFEKVKADDLKVRQDIRAPIVGPSSITPWMMFSRARWLKHQFFLMLDIAKLRSIQYQNADIRISNPTDQAEQTSLHGPS